MSDILLDFLPERNISTSTIAKYVKKDCQESERSVADFISK